jgi:hypothetical protein
MIAYFTIFDCLQIPKSDKKFLGFDYASYHLAKSL